MKDIYAIPVEKYQNNLEELTELLHSPRIFFLDEPTIGLDAVSKLAVREFILCLNQKHKTTVILTTHDMQDIEALTRRIILIGKGRVLMGGTLEDMRYPFGIAGFLLACYVLWRFGMGHYQSAGS